MNKIFLIGILTKNPQIKKLKSDVVMTTLRLLTTEKFNNKKIFNWHRIIMYNNLAKISNNILNEGDLIFIQGRIQNRKWINENNEIKYISEIISNEFKILRKDEKNQIDKKMNMNDFNFEDDLNSIQSFDDFEIKKNEISNNTELEGFEDNYTQGKNNDDINFENSQDDLFESQNN